jgi:hypothetical protein
VVGERVGQVGGEPPERLLVVRKQVDHPVREPCHLREGCRERSVPPQHLAHPRDHGGGEAGRVDEGSEQGDVGVREGRVRGEVCGVLVLQP